ncbi:MAG: hypothetical protein EHM20_06400 [Alphaproteobacteria bacterium]|nr:MAG: hypothetical protein EHM20_06400 [Alphaproteobacteria bacterium]
MKEVYWKAKIKRMEVKKNINGLFSALNYHDQLGCLLGLIFMNEQEVRSRAAASLALLAKNDLQDETIIKVLGNALLVETAQPFVYEQLIESLLKIGSPYAIKTMITNGIGNKQMVRYFYQSSEDAPIYKALKLNDNFVYLFTDSYDGDQNFRYFLSEYKSKFINKVTPEKQNEVKIDGLVNKGLYKTAFTVAHSESPKLVNFLANKLLIVINDKDLKSSNKMAAIMTLREIKETGMIGNQNLLHKIIDVVEH